MRPVFVYGVGRSGTSVLLKALGRHPQFDDASAVGEAPFIINFVKFINDYETASPKRSYHLAGYKLDERERALLFGRMLRDLHCPCPEMDLRKPFWTSKISLTNDPGDTALPAVTVSSFEKFFPGFGILYIIRNGVEVVNSARNFHGFRHIDFAALCERWRTSLVYSRLLETRADCAVVRHEDLVAGPHAVFAAVFKRLDVPGDPAPADYIATTVFNSSFTAEDASLPNGAPAALADRLTRAWTSWTDEQRQTFRRICGDEMHRYGFAIPDELPGRPWDQGLAGAGPMARPAARQPQQPAQYSPLVSRSDPGVAAVVVSSGVVAARSASATSSVLDQIDARVGRGDAFHCTHPAPTTGLLYIETPKAACTTIKYLVQSVEMEKRGEEPREFDRPTIHARARSPLPLLDDMSEEAIAGLLRDDDLFRFAIVRNPFDRVLSCYLSKIARPMPQRRMVIAVQDGIPHEEAADDGREISLRSFLEAVSRQNPRDMDIHWRPQMHQLLIGLVPYDFIGRYERLHDALGYVKARAFPDSTVALPASTNATGASDKLAQYFDDATVDLVRHIYAADFEAFGYETELAVAAQ